jgi:tetratricopeptide (TPR) repeat protein
VLIRENRPALEYLSELIAWRLKTCGERGVNEWNSDNPFFWRFTLQGKGVPPDAEEHAAGLWEKRDLPHAEAAFQILIDAFPDYADGYNYLGLIALERQDLGRAEDHFKKTIEVGRRLFPKRVARSSWWRDLKTRPYMRGLRNLAKTLLRGGKYDEATKVVDRLQLECADELSADSYRAAIALNTGEWKVAAESAARLRGLWPEEGLLEGLARVELGEHPAALEPLVHAALNKPKAVRLVLGVASSAPKTHFEAEDHNAGVHFRQMLASYLSKKSRGVTLLRRVASDARLARSMRRVEELCGKWFGHPRADRSIFDELTRMQRADFAAAQARHLADLIGGATAQPEGKSPPAAAKRRSRDGTSRRSLH